MPTFLRCRFQLTAFREMGFESPIEASGVRISFHVAQDEVCGLHAERDDLAAKEDVGLVRDRTKLSADSGQAGSRFGIVILEVPPMMKDTHSVAGGRRGSNP